MRMEMDGLGQTAPQADAMVRLREQEQVSGGADAALNVAMDRDRVEISPEGREQAERMHGGEQEDGNGAGRDAGEGKSVIRMRGRSDGRSGDADKEDAVDELQDTDTDIKRKKDEIREAKNAFFGSEEEQARKLKDLKQDLDDLEDDKKKLESTLAS